MNYIDMPPDATALMESTRAMGYSLETAVADIIDNSIAAEATRVEIFYSAVEKYVAILDDGYGMNSHDINRAMKYGGNSPLDARCEKDLGRFGLGMKTASLSQCEILTVVSKQGEKISARRWDLNMIRKTNKWTLLELSEEEIFDVPCVNMLKNLSSGTLVVWQDLDRMFQGSENIKLILPDKMNNVVNHLALVFHRYLAGESGLKKCSIAVNNLPVEPSDPFLKDKSMQIMDEEKIEIPGYPPIKIVPYMLPYPSKLSVTDKKILGITEDLQKNQGFYVYRNKRLIVWGKWFRLTKKETLSQLARIQIDIPPAFDKEWVLDVKKSTAVPPEIVRKKLEGIVEELTGKSWRTYSFRGKRETDKKFPHMWNRLKTRDGGITYEINESHPIFLRLIEKFPACEENFKNLLKLISASLPINQLMIDFHGSDEIKNSTLYSEEEARKILKVFLEGLSKAEVLKLLNSLARDDIFKHHSQLLEEFKLRGVD